MILPAYSSLRVLRQLSPRVDNFSQEVDETLLGVTKELHETSQRGSQLHRKLHTLQSVTYIARALAVVEG